MATRDDISRFIRSSFRSVWALELLLLLRADRRRWSHAEILAGLRGSDLVVTQSVENLTAAGLVDVDEAGAVAYTPVSEREAEMVEEAARFYATRPDQVRRMIVASPAGGLVAFADAFRIRKD